MSTMNPSVQIDERVFQKIMYWCRKAGNYEVSGLGNVVYDQKNNVFLVNEVYLLEQENTGTTTDINEEAIGKLMFEHHKAQKAGLEGELRFWWHSHANMNVFWSGTDIDTIKQLGREGWFLSTVFNNKEEMRSAFYMTDPMGVFSDELPTVIIQQFQDKEMERALARIGLQVRPGKMSEVRWAVEPFLSDKEQLEWEEEYDKKVKVKKYVPTVSTSLPNFFGGRNFSHNPLASEYEDDLVGRMVSEGNKESFPDFESRSASRQFDDLSEEEKEEIIDEIDEFIAQFPGVTRDELIETFQSEYPFIGKLIHPSYKGLSNE